MFLQINEQYRISSDRYNIIVEERKVIQDGEKKGEEYWTNIAYLPKLEDALVWLLNHQVRVTDLSDVQIIVQELHRLYAGFKQALAVNV